ncbi:MAG: hypothetical protein HY866_04070 [Chloroflexi bacterium]|nr:hypothetical protein [Chloroflexota bacterium]
MSSTQPPTWEEKIAGLRSQYDGLRSKVSMDDVTRQLGSTSTEIAGLPGEIAALRERGYAFAGYLERKADVLKKQWGEIRQQVEHLISQEMERIQRQFDELAGQWKRVEIQSTDKGKDQSFNLLKMGIETVEKGVDAARSRIEGMYGEVPDNVSQTQTQIQQIQGYLALADEAAIDWKPAEAIFMVHEAEWQKTNKEKPNGLLFLTDQRLIFEQKEKVGGRFGFGGEKVQQVLFETPVGAISEVKPEDKGVFGGKDLVHLKLSSGDTTFEVKGGIDSKWYAQQLNRAISGEIDKERAIPVDKSAAEAVKQVPTACPTCGASLPALTRGVTELECQYCGTKVRV